MNTALKEYLNKIKSAEVQTDPYMATRVMAHIESEQAGKKMWFWKLATISSLLTCILVLTLNYSKLGPASFGAEIHKPHLVKIEVAPFKFKETIQAEIILPKDVKFYSNDYATELADLKNIRLSVDPTMQSLPFIIKADAHGNKTITVKFYDSNDNLVQTKEVNIKFFEGLEGNS